MQTPLPKAASVDALRATPITTSGAITNGSGSEVIPGFNSDGPFAPSPTVSRTLGDIAAITPSQDAALISHDMVQRVLEVRLSVDDRDLGSVADAIDQVDPRHRQAPPATQIKVRGQSESMRTSFHSLEVGVLLAALLVYLLLVVLFQSFTDPLVIIVAVPGALCGVMLMLAITGTTLNVESLMGAIMSIGVATSNSILLVSFANEVREADESIDACEAARRAGRTRLRPVLMTAGAMILGMLPMAFGVGEGGEQNAPLARAVIGGLMVATFVTLFFVPTAYTLLRRPSPHKPDLDRSSITPTRRPSETEPARAARRRSRQRSSAPRRSAPAPRSMSRATARRSGCVRRRPARAAVETRPAPAVRDRDRRGDRDAAVRVDPSSSPHHGRRRRARAACARLELGLEITVATATVAPATRTVVLPGDVRAWRLAVVYARVSGYLEDLEVDRGDRVAKDQLLGRLTTPETEYQLRPLEANLATKQIIANRLRPLVPKGLVSQQDLDAADADVQQAQSDVDRLRAFKGFEALRAPFAGIVTQRYVDVGALMPAPTGSTQSAQPLVDIADVSRVRVVVYVGQRDATGIHVGDRLSIVRDDDPTDPIAGEVSRIPVDLDLRTRTMWVEADVDNVDGRLYPGRSSPSRSRYRRPRAS